MTPIQRQFVRLEEISSKTHLTKWDVLGAIEEGNLQLCAWVDETNFGALFRVDGQRSVAAVFDYAGVVKLTPQDSKRFAITLKKHSTNVCAVLQPSNIRNWRSVPQVFGKPDVLDIYYSETMPPKAKQGTAAYTKLAVVHNFASSVHKFCELYADLFPSESQSTSVQNLLDKHPVNKSYLKSYPLQIQPEHLRLNLDDIAKVFGHDSIRAFNAPTKQEQVTQCNSNALVQPLGNTQGSAVTHYVNSSVSASTVTSNRLDSVKPTVSSVKLTEGARTEISAPTVNSLAGALALTHPVSRIVYRVLQEHPQIRAGKVWNLIRQDVNQHTNRHYDTDSVIDEMTQDDMSWFGKGDTENRMSYLSFRKNIVADVNAVLKRAK